MKWVNPPVAFMLHAGVTLLIDAGVHLPHLHPGDRCSVEPYINCQRCYSCLRGHSNCCENHLTLGVMCDGGLCERIVLGGRPRLLALRGSGASHRRP